ncbi:hypothetical protein V8E36_001796 [Tilletia maclaganii]
MRRMFFLGVVCVLCCGGGEREVGRDQHFEKEQHLQGAKVQLQSLKRTRRARMRPRSEFSLGDDFEAVDEDRARCLICPRAPVFPNRKLQAHRETAGHQNNLRLPAHRLSATSARYQPAQPRAPLVSRETSPDFFDDYVAGFLDDLPPLPRSQFQRDWDKMQEMEEQPWQRDEQSEEDRRMIAELQARLAAAAKVDNDADFWPWPDRGIFVLPQVVMAPRTPLSRTVTELVIAFAKAIQHHTVPTLSAFRSATDKVRLRSPCKAVVPFQGVGGTPFFYNSVANGLARDFGNPVIRERLHFYPRCAGVKTELRDGEAMAQDSVRQPMVVLQNRSHAYLAEPVALTTGSIVMPLLWYTGRDGTLRGTGTGMKIALAAEGQGQRAVIETGVTHDFPVSDITRSSLLASQLDGLEFYDENNTKLPTSHPMRSLAKGKRRWNVPLLVWADDWRGTVGQGSYSHTSILYSNAGLDRADLDGLTSSVRFFSTSAAAEPDELLDAFVKEINDLHQHPTFVWDQQDKDDVLIRPYILAKVGDTVMLNKLASSIGVQGCMPCRLCDWGGTRSFKHTAEGVRAAIQEGEPRTSAGIIEQFTAQLDLAQDDKAQELEKTWTTSGIKDRMTTEACTILLEENDKLKGKVPPRPGQRRRALAPNEVQAQLSALRASLTQNTWHSPVHSISPFGGLDYTALDVLHIGPLGAGSALAKETKDRLNHAATDHLRVRLEALSTTAIYDAKSYPAATMIARLNTLNEKEVKVLTQLIPFALAPLCEEGMAAVELLETWQAYARPSRLLYLEYIADIDEHEVHARMSLADRSELRADSFILAETTFRSSFKMPFDAYGSLGPSYSPGISPTRSSFTFSHTWLGNADCSGP